jgi:predicted Zn-dependent protease
MKTLLAALTLVSLVSFAPVARAQKDDVETRAMKDELKRAMKDLHLESDAGPYFVAYKIVDTDRKEAQASLGALTQSGEVRNRMLTVTVRVGSYEFDNTGGPAGTGAEMLLGALTGSGTALPVDDNYDELRRHIWLATDTAYKRAVEQLSAKQAAAKNSNRDEKIASFSKAPARQETEISPFVDEKLEDAERLVKDASAVFRTLKSVEGGSAQYTIVNSTEQFINSEGTTYVRQESEISFHASASLQRESGETLSDSCAEFGRTAAEMPNEASLIEKTKAVRDRLAERTHGKAAKRYNGPVLLEGQAAAELFAQHFANLLSSRPRSGVSGNTGIAALLNGPTASLSNKMGSRVLPDFMDVTDNPQLTQVDGHALLGDYKFDEEGTPAQETVLVKDGILKTLLTSRTPARDMPQSTGNMREHGVMPGNLIVEAAKTSSEDELKAQMLELVKARDLEFGIIVRRMAGNAATEAARLYPDGHEEALRDARVADVSATSFKDILAVTKERTVFNEQVQFTSLLNASPFAEGDLISYVVPGMLFEDMTVERVSNESPKPPVVGSPLAAEESAAKN